MNVPKKHIATPVFILPTILVFAKKGGANNEHE